MIASPKATPNKKFVFDFEQKEQKYEVNSLLTKSVIQIIADVLKQLTAVIPPDLSHDKSGISFKNQALISRKAG